MKIRAKNLVVFFLVFVYLFGITQPPVIKGQEATLVGDQAYWLRLANNAWNYFQPGVGIDSTTGLQSSGLGYLLFTDWDLGIYIQAIIAANQLGILSTDGPWGADARINKTLTFLQTRQLSLNGVPYVWYQSTSGNPYGLGQQSAADAGEFLMALNDLRVFRPDLTETINYIVYNRTNYSPLEQSVDYLTSSTNIYDYYVATGFASFWPTRFSTLPNSILNNIVSAPTVSTYGVELPISILTCEPLLLSVFNLPSNAKLNSLADQVYSAHEARYNATTKFTAFTEGNTGPGFVISYVYEWVIKDDGSTWTIEDAGQGKVDIVPIIYFKAAVGLLAMHNTPFTRNMASTIESQLPTPSKGYSDGIDENGRIVTYTTDKNGMIIQAALYAIRKLQNPTPTPISSSSPGSSTPTPTFSPLPAGSPTPTSTLSPLVSPTLFPSSSTGPFLNNQRINMYVMVFVALILLGCASLVIVIGFKRRNASKSDLVLCMSPARYYYFI